METMLNDVSTYDIVLLSDSESLSSELSSDFETENSSRGLNLASMLDGEGIRSGIC